MPRISRMAKYAGSALLVLPLVAGMAAVAQAAPDASITLSVDTPASVTAGAAATKFTGTLSDKSTTAYPAVRYDIAFTGDPGLTASQITMQYETSPGSGVYQAVPLTGSTAGNGSITGYFGPQTGFPLKAGGATGYDLTTKFAINVAANAPLGTLKSVVTLDEVSGTIAGNTLATDTKNTDIVSKFSDVTAGNPFAVQIDTLAGEGVIGGYPDGTFHSSAPVERQAFAAFMARVLGLTTGTAAAPCTNPADNKYRDVSSANPFCEAISKLTAAGIVKGYSDGGFHPTASITRQAIASFIERADSWLKHSKNATLVTDASCTTPTPFSDVSSTNPFCGDIEFLAAHGITTGDDDGTFGITRATSRQATAAFLVRFQTYEASAN